MNRSEVRRDALLSAFVGIVMALAIGAGGMLMLTSEEEKAIPGLSESIRSGTDAVGKAVADLITMALDDGIPLDGLYGVDSYFDNVVAGVPTIDALALVRPDGSPLWQTEDNVTGASFPVISGEQVRARLIVAPAPPFFGQAVHYLRAALAATAVLFGLVGSCLTYMVLRRSVSVGRERLRTSMRSVIDGVFPTRSLPVGRGVAVDAMAGFDHRLAPLTESVRRLEDEVATVRAIDFDGSLSASLGPILEPVAAARAIVEADEERPTDRLRRMFVVWLTVVLLGLYAMAVPFVANFAVDRQWAYAPEAWWPSLPWIVECAIALAGYILARNIPPSVRPPAALAGILVAGAGCASAYFVRDYDAFLLSRGVSGAGLGVAVSAMVAGRSEILRDRLVAPMLIVALLVIGPLLGGLLGEAVGRRLTFLITGLALIGTSFFAISARWIATTRDTARREPILGWSNRAAAAGVAAGAVALVLIPIGPGYEAYLITGLFVAAIGLSAVLLPLTPWPLSAGLTLIGLALLTVAPDLNQTLWYAAATIAAALAIGWGTAGLVKGAVTRLAFLLESLTIGLALGAASVSVAGTLALPQLSITGGLVAVLSLAGWLFARRAATSRPG